MTNKKAQKILKKKIKNKFCKYMFADIDNDKIDEMFVLGFSGKFVDGDDKKKTLPILIAQLRSADFLKFDMGQVYVTIAFSIFPVIIVYLLLSKYIVGGVAVGAVKG